MEHLQQIANQFHGIAIDDLTQLEKNVARILQRLGYLVFVVIDGQQVIK